MLVFGSWLLVVGSGILSDNGYLSKFVMLAIQNDCSVLTNPHSVNEL
ncbi:MAG: hypothetical protein JWM56_488 [Candidatus Peribacteria bacterium]|nr:hypothetical protein [Candidatus Peribacteria bacterium]